MQQKIQLVGTVLHKPDLLVLDEPFSGLDPINQGLFKDLLAEYRREGRAVLFSTHIMEQADKLCDRICLISRGRAVLEGGLGEIKRRFGGHSYRLVADGDLDGLAAIPGVAQAIPREDGAKLRLEDDARGAEVLPRLVEAVTVHEFRSEEPELEEIFIQVVGEAEALLLERHGIGPREKKDFSVQDTTEIAAMLSVVTGTMTALLAAIAGISLLVGGIGIMNIMLVSVTERTREIGVRKALGAKRRDILTQFLIESVTLAVLGGWLGAEPARALGRLVARAKQMPLAELRAHKRRALLAATTKELETVGEEEEPLAP